MPKTRKLTIIAQDPSVTDQGRIVICRVTIPYELVAPGPRGHRVHVVDYDASQGVLYQPAELGEEDRFADASDDVRLEDPGFHAQNTYAIVTRILDRFQFALGRRLAWGCGGHQIYVAPHAFADANAYYSEEDRAIFLGYFPGRNRKTKQEMTVHTCLSHDVVAHETTHAILDGLRDYYTKPSGPDQAGFHEGYADVVALLSVFGLRNVLGSLLAGDEKDPRFIRKDRIGPDALRHSVLLGMAEQFGLQTSDFRDKALRRAVDAPPREDARRLPAYEECHDRGMILSAAILNAFVEVWRKRLEGWLPGEGDLVSRARVVEDGAEAAEHLLTMIIRALDYCPVIHVAYEDFLAALITADRELLPDDGKYAYRDALRQEFHKWGIDAPAITGENPDVGQIVEAGAWQRPLDERSLNYDWIHSESLHRDPDEVFRFLWENRRQLKVYEGAYTSVVSVRPCMRIGPDGFSIRETVAEYLQMVDVKAEELKRLQIRKPTKMPDNTPVRLHGGGVLVFDEFCHLKYHVRTRLDSPEGQRDRLQFLWENGVKDEEGGYGASDGVPRGRRFSLMHLRRSGRVRREERWDG